MVLKTPVSLCYLWLSLVSHVKFLPIPENSFCFCFSVGSTSIASFRLCILNLVRSGAFLINLPSISWSEGARRLTKTSLAPLGYSTD